MNASSFWDHVTRSRDPGACWPWTGARSGAGYGVLVYDGRRVYAHRFAYQLAIGPIQDNAIIRHTCDNLLCCRPEHLLAGTPQDNSTDMVQHGRHRNRVLSPDQVRAIREMHAHRARLVDICDHYGISQNCVQKLISYRTHRGVS